MTSFFYTIDKQTTPDPISIQFFPSVSLELSCSALISMKKLLLHIRTMHPLLYTGRHRLNALESTEDHGSSPILIPVMVHGSSCRTRTRRTYVYCLVGTLSAVEDDLRTLTIPLIPTTPSLSLLSSLTQAELSMKIVNFLIVYFASALLHIYNLNRYSIKALRHTFEQVSA